MTRVSAFSVHNALVRVSAAGAGAGTPMLAAAAPAWGRERMPPPRDEHA